MSSILKGVALFFVIAVVIALLLPPVKRSREAARRTQCKNNLKQIVLALNAYESEYGVFPPAFTANSEGQPLHSWRTLILPYLDQEDLYKKIDLSKPWNDPTNAEVYQTPVYTLCCPSAPFPDSNLRPSCMTTYLAAVTEDSCLRPIESLKKKQISDTLSSTLMVIELRTEDAVHWMQPADADLETILEFSLLKRRTHVGGIQSAFADGSVRFISENTPETTLRALVSASGGEVVGDF